MKASSPQPFIDQLSLRISSGHGGAGASSYRREYKVARGGPDGGDGGRGGDVIISGDSRKHTLLDFRYKRIYAAKDGEPGKGARCYGKSGDHEVLNVPLGTQVYNAETGELLHDVITEESFTILEGGKGGLGNWHFKNSKNQAPSYSQKGLPGVELDLRLELKLIADMGLVGFPNAGKSTLLTHLSNAKSKVGSYPFTTLNPQLGVLRHKNQEVVLADLPGLIEGASEGVGLGHKFLKHVERTQKILHLVSMEKDELQEPYARYQAIRKELKDYKLGQKPLDKLDEIVILTKSDLLRPEEVEKHINSFKEMGHEVIVISSVTNRNIDRLKDLLIQVNHQTEDLI